MWNLKALDDLWYDADNLRETARYCRFHHEGLRDLGEDAVERLLWDRLRMQLGPLTKENVRSFEGRFEEAHTPAHFLIERLSAPAGSGLRGSHLITFYIRPGKPPAIDSASLRRVRPAT